MKPSLVDLIAVAGGLGGILGALFAFGISTLKGREFLIDITIGITIGGTCGAFVAFLITAGLTLVSGGVALRKMRLSLVAFAWILLAAVGGGILLESLNASATWFYVLDLLLTAVSVPLAVSSVLQLRIQALASREQATRRTVEEAKARHRIVEEVKARPPIIRDWASKQLPPLKRAPGWPAELSRRYRLDPAANYRRGGVSLSMFVLAVAIGLAGLLSWLVGTVSLRMILHVLVEVSGGLALLFAVLVILLGNRYRRSRHEDDEPSDEKHRSL
jgi:hypothetical protein